MQHRDHGSGFQNHPAKKPCVYSAKSVIKQKQDPQHRLGGKWQPSMHAGVNVAPPPRERNLDAGTVEKCTRKVAALDNNSPRAQELTVAIARMLIADCQPFSMVGDVAFKTLLRVAEPRYRIPNRSVFSEEIIPRLYETEKGKIERNP